MLAILLPCGGGPEIPILASKVVVGRSPGCDVLLDHRSISGRHCELELVKGWWRVCDLGSSNGTKINGRAINTNWLLPDDELMLGKERFYLVYVAPEGQAPPSRGDSLEIIRKPIPAKPQVQRRKVARAWTLGELVPCAGGESIPLLKTVVVVGRTAECDVAINTADVSSKHCRLEFTEGYWFVRDLGSRNGTRVDNKPCSGVTPLVPDSVLAVGRQRYRLVYEPSAGGADTGSLFDRGLLEKAGLEEWQPDPDSEG
jgi:pSer/pThr/pTyr-binding forkhead associated (FHA) protein